MAEQKAIAGANSLDSVVEAFDDALGPVLKEIVVWTIRAVPPERPSS